MYSINFTKNFCLNLYYNGAESYLFVNGTKIHKFKTKDFEIVLNPLCLGSISKKILFCRYEKYEKGRIKCICI